MNNHDFLNKNILKIKSEVYFVTRVNYILTGILTIFALKLSVIFEFSQTTNQIGLMAGGTLFFSGVIGLSYYFRSDKLFIKFSENNINKGAFSLNINEIKEVYRVSFLFTLGTDFGISRFNLLSRIILVLLLPILVTIYVLNIIFKKIYYKEKVLHDLLVIVGKSDKQVIWVQLPLKDKEKQKKLENYCKKYLGRDITSLKTKFFIPNNEKWFIQS